MAGRLAVGHVHQVNWQVTCTLPDFSEEVPAQLLQRQRRDTGAQPTALAWLDSDQVQILLTETVVKGFSQGHGVPRACDFPRRSCGQRSRGNLPHYIFIALWSRYSEKNILQHIDVLLSS